MVSINIIARETAICHTSVMAAQKINAPFATPERSADVLGVSKARYVRLVRWAREASPEALPSKRKVKEEKPDAKSVARKAAK